MFETPMTDFSDYIEKNKKKRKKTFNIKKLSSDESSNTTGMSMRHYTI